MRLNAQPEGAFPKPRGGVDRISVNYKTIDIKGGRLIFKRPPFYIKTDEIKRMKSKEVNSTMQTSLLLWAANKAVFDLSSFYRTIKQIKTVQPQL